MTQSPLHIRGLPLHFCCDVVLLCLLNSGRDGSASEEAQKAVKPQVQAERMAQVRTWGCMRSYGQLALEPMQTSGLKNEKGRIA